MNMMKEDQERKSRDMSTLNCSSRGLYERKNIGLAGGSTETREPCIYLDVGGACTYQKSMWSILTHFN